MKYSILFLFMLNFTISNVFSQRVITGRVVDFDTEKPIEGAIIKSNGFEVITKSNHLGYFKFNADVTDTIQIRRKGYAISNFALPDKNHFIIKINKVDNSSIVMIDDVYIKGEIQNHYKTGIWEYYDKPGELALKYDFDLGRIVYLRTDTSQYAVKFDTGYRMTHVDVPPHTLGSMQELYTAFDFYSYPEIAKKNLTAGTIYIMFEVDPNGYMGNFTVLNDIGDGVGTEAINTLKKFPYFWIPAQIGNKSYSSRFIIPITFKIEALENGYKKSVGKIKKHKRSKEYLPAAHFLHEYTVTTVLIK